jgi:sugar lactone lactonase YvrE
MSDALRSLRGFSLFLQVSAITIAIGLLASALPAQTVVPYTATPGSPATPVRWVGMSSYSGDINGYRTSAKLNQPYGLAVDGQGNLYIGENAASSTGTGGAYVRKVDAVTGQVTFFAGGYGKSSSSTSGLCTSGQTDNSGNGCPATPAYLDEVRGIAVDAKGDVYLSDEGASAIRKVDGATGIITRFFGSSSGGGWSSDGLASTTAVHNPRGIAAGPDGSVYVADAGNNAIRKAYLCTSALVGVANTCTAANVGTWQVVTLNSTTGTSEPAGGCSVATQAVSSLTVTNAYDLAVDAAGNLYIEDGGCYSILEVTADANKRVWPSSTVQLLIGTGQYGSSSNWITAGGALGNAPRGLTVDSAGNVYFSDGSNLWFYDVNTQNIHQIVSGGFLSAYSISHDASGNIYVADTNKPVVWQIPTNLVFPATAQGSSSAAQTITVHYPAGYTAPLDGTAFVSSGDFTFGLPVCTNYPSGANGDGTSDCDVSITFNPAKIGWVKAAVEANSIPLAGGAAGTPTHFALSGTATGAAAAVDPGSATVLTGAANGQPNGVAVDRAGNVYVADPALNQVLKFPAGTTSNPTVIAGSDSAGYSGDGGSATLAQLDSPEAVAVDPAGNVFIADTANNAVRRVDASSGDITTVISSTLNFSLNGPSGLAADAKGNVYVADTGDNVVLVFDPRWDLVNYFAGGGSTTTSSGPCTPGGITKLSSPPKATDNYGDGCDPLNASLNAPTGLAVDGSGNVYIADTGNGLLREVNVDAQTITQAVTGSLAPAPESLALDMAGNIYYLGSDGNVYMIAAGASSSASLMVYGQLGSNVPMSVPAGIAFDGSGILYVADSGDDTVLAVNRTTPAIAFGEQTAGSANHDATGLVSNIGSAGFTLASPWDALDDSTGTFSVPSFTCSDGMVMGSGASCDFVVAFAPPANASYNATLGINSSLSTSPVVALSGAGGPPPTNVSCQLSGQLLYGATQTVTCTVAPQDQTLTQTPTGTLTFYVDLVAQTPVVPMTSGGASLQLNALTVGRHYIYAVYSGDSAYYTSTSISHPVSAVIQAPTVTELTVTPATTPQLGGTTITLNAAVVPAPARIATGKITFQATNTATQAVTTLGTVAVSGLQASFSTSGLATACYNFTATYGGDVYDVASTSLPVGPYCIIVTFTMTASPAEFTVLHGTGTGTTTAFLAPLGSPSEQVNITCAGLPAGASCSGSGTFTGNDNTLSVPVTFSASSSSWPPVGPYSVTLTATGAVSGAQASTSIRVKFQPAGSPNNSFVVAADGSADFSTVQSAVSALPATGGTISINPGIYRELVTVTQPNVTLLGQGYQSDGVTENPSAVIVVYNNNAAQFNGSSSASASVYVETAAHDFYAENLTFENDSQIQSGYGLGQGVAFRISADRGVMRNVQFIGLQDTLLSDSQGCSSNSETCTASRHYYYNCLVFGVVDYMYGDAAAVFDSCTIESAYHSTVTMTAQGRSYMNYLSGFVYNNAQIITDNTPATQVDPMLSLADPNTEGLGNMDARSADYYLGRPYFERSSDSGAQPLSTVIFMNSNFQADVSGAGWEEWTPGTTDYLATAIYELYNNTGNAPNCTSGALEQYATCLTAAQAAQYATTTFLAGSDGWNPTVVTAVQPAATAGTAAVEEDSSVAITLSGTTSTGNSLTYTIASSPANGTLSGTAPNLTYTPNLGFYGTDSFTFIATDAYSKRPNSAPATISITVNERTAVAASVTAANKTYDGTTTATITSCTLTGVAAADQGNVTCAAASASFASADVGTGITVTAAGITLSGSAAGAYMLSSTTAAASANISQATPVVTVTCPANAVYTGSAQSCSAVATGVNGGDISALGTFTWTTPQAETNAGTYTVAATFSGSTDYASAGGSTSFTISPASQHPSVVCTAVTYDGNGHGCTATSSVSGGSCTSSTVTNVPGGLVTLNCPASSDGNYAAWSDSTHYSLTINPLLITATVTAAGKTYDGGTLEPIANITSCVVNGVLTADVGNVGCLLTGAAASFNDPSVAKADLVTVTGIGLNGSAAGNYSLSPSSAAAPAAITAALVTPGILAVNKVYDTTVSEPLANITCSLQGVVASDAGKVTCAAAAASFNDASVANANLVTATGITLSGSAAGNYALTAVSAEASASITPAAVTVNLAAGNKVYDATTTEPIANLTSCTVKGVLSADAGNVSCLLTNAAASFNDPSVAKANLVTVTGIGLSGTAAGNYSLSANSATAPAAITAAPVTPSILAVNKVYDGTVTEPLANINCSLQSVVASDAGKVTCTAAAASFAGADVANGITVTARGITLSGLAAGNYALTATTAATTANITPATPVVTGNCAVATYEGQAVAAASFCSATVTGVKGTTICGGSAPACSSAQVTWTPASVSAAGATSVTATYAGSLDYSSAGSAAIPWNLTVNPLLCTVVDAGGNPLASGANEPFGAVLTIACTPSISGLKSSVSGPGLLSIITGATSATGSLAITEGSGQVAVTLKQVVNGKTVATWGPFTVTAVANQVSCAVTNSTTSPGVDVTNALISASPAYPVKYGQSLMFSCSSSDGTVVTPKVKNLDRYDAGQFNAGNGELYIQNGAGQISVEFASEDKKNNIIANWGPYVIQAVPFPVTFGYNLPNGYTYVYGAATQQALPTQVNGGITQTPAALVGQDTLSVSVEMWDPNTNAAFKPAKALLTEALGAGESGYELKPVLPKTTQYAITMAPAVMQFVAGPYSTTLGVTNPAATVWGPVADTAAALAKLKAYKFSLQNLSGADVVWTATVSGADPSDFTVGPPCESYRFSATAADRAGCSISVSFQPQGVGTFTADVTISAVDKSTGATVYTAASPVAFTGYAYAPGFSPSGVSLPVGGGSQQTIITNTTGFALSYSGSNVKTPFTVGPGVPSGAVTDCMAGPVAPGAQCSLTISYTLPSRASQRLAVGATHDITVTGTITPLTSSISLTGTVQINMVANP